MTSLSSKWSKPQKTGISERINNIIKPSGALKPRVETAIKKLQAQVAKLDVMLSSLNSRDEKIFHRIITATQQLATCRNLDSYGKLSGKGSSYFYRRSIEKTMMIYNYYCVITDVHNIHNNKYKKLLRLLSNKHKSQLANKLP